MLDLEMLLRQLARPFDHLLIVDWYDGVLSAVVVLELERVALYLEAIWADQAFPNKENYLYRVSTLPYAEISLLLTSPVSRWDTAQALAWESLLPQAVFQNLLLQFDADQTITSIWRPVEPGTGSP